MEKTKSTILFLLVLLLVHIEAYAGVITKSFYVPVVKGVYEEEEPEGLIEEAIEQETEIATPTDESVFVIVSEPIRIDVLVDDGDPGESGEPEEVEIQEPEITGE